MEPVEGFRPVAINIGVRSIEEAIEFYEGSFGAKLETSESRGRPVHARWQFGADDSFFVFNIRERAAEEAHREHVSVFGFVVDDLDMTHARALAAGATEHFSPMEHDGLPRHSRIEDPSGNRIVLWQG
jgi:predicted enzyme related to lactoylglutathione lyase